MDEPILVGAVAYDPKVVPIWEGIRDYFRGRAGRDGFRPVLQLRSAGRGAARRARSTSPGTPTWPTCGSTERTEGACRVAGDARHRRRVPPRCSCGRTGASSRRRPTCAASGSPWGAPTRPRPRSCRCTTSRREGLELGRRGRAAAVRLRRRQARRHRPQRAARRSKRCSTAGPTLRPSAAPSWDVLSCARARSRPARLEPFWTSPAVLRIATSRRCPRSTPGSPTGGPRTCARWTGRIRSIVGSSSWKGCALGRTAARRVRRCLRGGRGGGDAVGHRDGDRRGARCRTRGLVRRRDAGPGRWADVRDRRRSRRLEVGEVLEM